MPGRYFANFTSSLSASHKILIISFEKTTFILTADSICSQFSALSTYRALPS